MLPFSTDAPTTSEYRFPFLSVRIGPQGLRRTIAGDAPSCASLRRKADLQIRELVEYDLRRRGIADPGRELGPTLRGKSQGRRIPPRIGTELQPQASGRLAIEQSDASRSRRQPIK